VEIAVLRAAVAAMKKAAATPVEVVVAEEDMVVAAAVDTIARSSVPRSSVAARVVRLRPNGPSSARLPPSRMMTSARVRSRTAWKTMTFRFDTPLNDAGA
jgi:hypothetical protein